MVHSATVETIGIRKYKAVADVLRRDIARSYHPGQLFPPERELTRLYGVSITTMRRALRILTKEGLVVRQQGRGTIVASSEGAQQKGRKTILVLLLADTVLLYEQVRNLEKHLFDAGYAAWVYALPHGSPAEMQDRIRHTIKSCGHVAGIICGPVFGRFNEVAEVFEDSRAPVVYFHPSIQMDGNYVAVNTAVGMLHALRHLVEIGCRSIRYVGRVDLSVARQVPTLNSWAISAGLVDFIDKYWSGGTLEDLVIPAGPTIESGYAAASRLFQDGSIPDGILTSNELCAAGVVLAAKEYDVNVPEDMALAAAHNDFAGACGVIPRLTSVDIPTEEMAAALVRIMDELMAAGSVPAKRHVLLESRLNVRESTTGFRPRLDGSGIVELEIPVLPEPLVHC